MRREIGQLGFVDLATREISSRADVFLGRALVVLDWSEIGAVLKPVYAAPTGRPSHDPLVLFRMLLLEAWYRLSDVEAEDQVRDRLSFRRFVGLGLEADVPDHSTLSRFRSLLVREGLDAQLFTAVAAALENHGLVLKEGTLIDASFVESAVARPHGPRSTSDDQARWGSKGKAKRAFGYKLHVAVDAGSRLVRAILVTAANVNDCVPAPALVQGDEAEVLADMAYDSRAMRDHLAAAGVANGVMKRPNRHHPVLPPDERARNRAIASRRSLVEGVFGTLKRSMGLTRTRFIGLAKATAELRLACLALNIKRAATLVA